MNNPEQNNSESDEVTPVTLISEEHRLQFEQRLRAEAQFKKAKVEQEEILAALQASREKHPPHELPNFKPKLRVHMILLGWLSSLLRRVFQ